MSSFLPLCKCCSMLCSAISKARLEWHEKWDMLSNTIKWKLELQWAGKQLQMRMERQRGVSSCICFLQQEYYIFIFRSEAFVIGLCVSIWYCDAVCSPMKKQMKLQLPFQNTQFRSHSFGLHWHQLWLQCPVTDDFKTPFTCFPLLWELLGQLMRRVHNIDTKWGLRWSELLCQRDGTGLDSSVHFWSDTCLS